MSSRANAESMREAAREAKRARSVRARVVLMTAVVATSLVGCAPDVISVNGASRPPSELEQTFDVTLPSLQPDSPACGADDSVDLSDRLLTLRDVWPTETGGGEAYTNYTLPPDTCAALVDTGVAGGASCDRGFPYFAHAELVPALASLGVTEYHAIHLDQVTSQNTVSSTVDETWLKLPPNDMSWLISLVDSCGATVGGDYLVTRSGTSIRLLLRVLGDSAVVLTFDDRSGLSNSWKLKLLDKATTLVAIGR